VIERKVTGTGPRYEVRLRGPDGRERFKCFRTVRDGERYEREQRRSLDRGDWIDPRHATVTFEEYAKAWLFQRTDLRPRTVELYESLLRRHLLPPFGSLPIGKITPAGVRSWHSSLSAEYLVTGAKAYRLLRGILGTAVTDELMGRNPCTVKGAGRRPRPSALC
jgi:Phage integrase, N-terminal SAM-like domain